MRQGERARLLQRAEGYYQDLVAAAPGPAAPPEYAAMYQMLWGKEGYLAAVGTAQWLDHLHAERLDEPETVAACFRWAILLHADAMTPGEASRWALDLNWENRERREQAATEIAQRWAQRAPMAQ